VQTMENANRASWNWPLASRAGELIFLGGHTPHDLDNGRLVLSTADLPAPLDTELRAPVLFTEVVAGRCRAQTRQVLENLKASLTAAGGSIERMAHLRIFLSDIILERTVLTAVKAFFGDSLPSGEIIEARNAGSHSEILVQMDGIGVALEAPAPEHLHLDGFAPLTRPFPTATKAAGLLFSSQMAGADPATGEALTEPLRLSPRGLSLLDTLADGASDYRLPFFVQQAALWDQMLGILDRLGIPPENTLYHMNWMRQPMSVFADGSVTRSITATVGDYLLTCFPTSGLRTSGAELEGRIVAILPGSGLTKDIRVPIHGISNSYFGMIKVGPWLFAAGEVPIETSQHILMDAFTKLPRPLARHAIGRPYPAQPIQPQAHYIFHLYEETLAAYGADFADVVHQTAYLSDAGDGPAFEGVSASRFGTSPPAATVVPILGASPFTGTRLELEMTAYLPE